MENVFKKLGYSLVMPEDITGFYTVVDTGKPGPEILILAELDSIICPEHKEANPETGAVIPRKGTRIKKHNGIIEKILAKRKNKQAKK